MRPLLFSLIVKTVQDGVAEVLPTSAEAEVQLSLWYSLTSASCAAGF